MTNYKNTSHRRKSELKNLSKNKEATKSSLKYTKISLASLFIAHIFALILFRASSNSSSWGMGEAILGVFGFLILWCISGSACLLSLVTEKGKLVYICLILNILPFFYYILINFFS